MSATLEQDRVEADTRGEWVTAALRRSHAYIGEIVRSGSQNPSFSDWDLAADYVTGAAARRLHAHEPGYSVSLVDNVSDHHGRLNGPAAVAHRLDAPHEPVAAFHLPLDIGRQPVSLPDPQGITEITRLGIAAVNARRRTERAADCWATVAAIADDFDRIVLTSSGEERIAEWVQRTEDDCFDFTDDRRHIRRSLDTGDNIDRDRLEPWERFVIWDQGNCSLHVAHAGADPADHDDPIRIVATIDNQSAEHHAAMQAVAVAAVGALRDELARHTPHGTNVIPVQFRCEAGHPLLSCLTAEPDVTLLDGPLRPLRHASVGIVANPQYDPLEQHPRTIWADHAPNSRPPARTLDTAGLM